VTSIRRVGDADSCATRLRPSTARIPIFHSRGGGAGGARCLAAMVSCPQASTADPYKRQAIEWAGLETEDGRADAVTLSRHARAQRDGFLVRNSSRDQLSHPSRKISRSRASIRSLHSVSPGFEAIKKPVRHLTLLAHRCRWLRSDECQQERYVTLIHAHHPRRFPEQDVRHRRLHFGDGSVPPRS
jgi:hypothetical protein